MNYDLKSESEVKEYINNLGIEYRFGCYSEKNPEVCHLLGDFLEAIKKDYEKAAKVYKSNCDEYKYGKSCLKYGNFNILGRGIKNGTYKTAYEYYDKGCELGDAQSCFHQGLLLITKNEDRGIARDVPKAISRLEKSCDGDNGLACFYLSAHYIMQAKQGRDAADSNTDNPMRSAFKYASKGCELGNAFSCANLSQMYAKGEGVERNEELARKFKEKVKDLEGDVTSMGLEIGLLPT